MEACSGSKSGNRRHFLQATAAGASLVAAAHVASADPQAPDAKAVPTVILGKTGQKVTKLGMGTSWALSPSFVQLTLFSGVRYIDTSEGYENTVAEKVIGDVLERTKLRKETYLVTKFQGYRTARGARALPVMDAEAHCEPGAAQN